MRLSRVVPFVLCLVSCRPDAVGNPDPLTTVNVRGRLVWDDSLPVAPGQGACASVDVAALHYAPGAVQPTLLHASANSQGEYAISWGSRCYTLEMHLQFVVTCNSGHAAGPITCAGDIACTSGWQTKNCVFSKASCQ